jgi:hypothetical protein
MPGCRGSSLIRWLHSPTPRSASSLRSEAEPSRHDLDQRASADGLVFIDFNSARRDVPQDLEINRSCLLSKPKLVYQGSLVETQHRILIIRSLIDMADMNSGRECV